MGLFFPGAYNSFTQQSATNFGFGGEAQLGFTMRVSVPIQGWNANFNPLLSLPLVDIGNQIEEYRITGGVNDASTMTYRPWFDATMSTYHAGLNTIDKLGVVDNNSTNGWNFKATQNIKITATFSSGNNSAAGAWSWVKTPSDPVTFTSTTNNTNDATVFDGFRIAGGNNSITAGTSHSMTVAITMKPGEYLWLVKNYNANENADYFAGINICVEKDYGNTNMAHIIKPAVATLMDVRASTVAADSAGTGGFNNRKLNTIRGESWFVTLTGTGTTGIGGNNTDFTLEPGTYNVKAYAPTFNCNSNKIRLYDVTNDSNGNIGLYCYTDSNDDGSMIGFYQEVIHVTSSTEYRLQQWTDAAGTLGFGGGAGAGSGDNIYTQVVIEKLK
jgi:hypothetical protein